MGLLTIFLHLNRFSLPSCSHATHNITLLNMQKLQACTHLVAVLAKRPFKILKTPLPVLSTF